jgi:hypothetical protein
VVAYKQNNIRVSRREEHIDCDGFSTFEVQNGPVLGSHGARVLNEIRDENCQIIVGGESDLLPHSSL